MLLYEELTNKIIGAAVEVQRQLGPGFLEAVYENALAHEFDLKHVAFERQIALSVRYKDICAGEYRIDFLVDKQIIVEIKATLALNPAHESQALNYLAATGHRLALLLNFGTKPLGIKRIIR